MADLRSMAGWPPPQVTADDLTFAAWKWEQQAEQSTNQRMAVLAINAPLVQLYQPNLVAVAEIPGHRKSGASGVG